MHAMPRYVEVTGLDLKEMLCGTAHLSYNLVDVAIRRLNQLDIMMYVLNKLIHWRHILESDFAVNNLGPYYPISFYHLHASIVC
jgi:hypothetical protein